MSNHLNLGKAARILKFFIKYEDLEHNKFETFKKLFFIESLKPIKNPINEKKLINSINSTNFVNQKIRKKWRI